MSVDYTRTDGEATPDSESNMFAPTPMWDRSKKNRAARRSMFRDEPAETGAAMTGAAGGVAADRVMTGDRVVTDDATRETVMSPNGDDAFVATPTQRTTVRRDRSMAPAAVVVGLVAIAALAAAGWYATRPGDTALTPGGPNAPPATSVASTSTTTSAGGANLAANTPPAEAAAPAATHTATTRSTTTTTRVASAEPVVRHRSSSSTVVATPERSVTSRSATGAGVNTGATVPVAPPSATVTQTPAGAVPSVPQTAAPPPAEGPTTAVTPPVSATPTTPSPTPSTAPPATTTVTPPATTTAPSPTPDSTTPQ